MWRIIGFALGVALTPSAWASIACFEKATGKFLSAQSPGSPGICVQNHVQYGYLAEQIEERELSGEEVAAIVKAANDKLPKPAEPVEIPIESFGAGLAGALTAFGGKNLVLLVRKKKETS